MNTETKQIDDNNEEYKSDTKENKRKLYVEGRWLKGPFMCEICGRNKATVNLDLKYGSHKECRYCWDH